MTDPQNVVVTVAMTEVKTRYNIPTMYQRSEQWL